MIKFQVPFKLGHKEGGSVGSERLLASCPWTNPAQRILWRERGVGFFVFVYLFLQA